MVTRFSNPPTASATGMSAYWYLVLSDLCTLAYEVMGTGSACLGEMMHFWPQVYERMQEQALAPTATTYTALVSAHCKSDNLDAALEVPPPAHVTDFMLLSMCNLLTSPLRPAVVSPAILKVHPKGCQQQVYIT